MTDARAKPLRGVATALVVLGAGYLLSLSFAHYFAQSIERHRLESGWFIFAFLCVAAALLFGRQGAPVSSADHGGLDRASVLVALAVFSMVSLLLYLPALSIGLLSDDFVLVGAASGRVPLPEGWFFRPVPLLVWRLLGMTGIGSPAHHLLNVLLHAANAVLVALIALRYRANRRVALTAASIFLVFPASVEAVAWISGLQDVLATTLCLLFVWTIGQRSTRPPSGAVALAALLLALGTKEVAVIAPVLALLTYAMRPAGGPLADGDGRAGSRTWTSMAFVLGFSFVLVAGFGLWRLATIDTGEFVVAPSRYLFQRMLSLAFGSLGLPWRTDELRGAPILTLAWTAGLILLLAWTTLRVTWRSERGRDLVRLTAWVVLAVLPVYSMFFVADDLEGSRYLYLATPAWALLMAFLIDALRPLSRGLAAVCLAVVLTVSVIGVRLHLRPWVGAAALRDRVLAAATEVATSTDCSRVSFGGLPGSVDGAYVLRNGFERALAARLDDQGIAAAELADGSTAECAYVWADGSFVRGVR